MNNLPSTDIWRLIDNDPDSQHFNQYFRFDFSFFESTAIKITAKKYIWSNYITGSRAVSTLRGTLGDLVHFDAFCRENSVQTLKDLDHGLVEDYRSFLSLYISPSTKKPLSYSSQGKSFSTLKSIVGWCHTFCPEVVPAKALFTGNEYNHVRGRIKIRYIPDEIITLINRSLKNEMNPYLKYGIIILQYTGMRIGDLLMLSTNCVSAHPISGYTMSWFEHKTRKNRVNVPITNECKKAVDELIRVTAPIRKDTVATERDRLFIYSLKRARRKKPVTVISTHTFGRWCRTFCNEHHIIDGFGNPYQITSHMFRRTLATDMLSKGINLKVIQDLLGHTSPAITRRYYADVKDPERVEMFSKIGILGDIKSVGSKEIPDQDDLYWFQNNLGSRARLCDGYCTLPIQDGKPCGRFLSRQKCYLCSRYITTLEDLNAHKEHLQELEELLSNNIYGEHFAAHIIPTTIVLKEIIRRLEELKDEQ